MKTLGSLFSPFGDCAKISDAILKGEVTDVKINNEVRLISLNVNFDTYIACDELIKAEKVFSKALNSSVIIKPKYPPELFSADHFQSLYTTVKREMPSINGTLNNAEVTYENNELTIRLNNGGKALLDAKEFDKALERIILEQFSLSVRVKYTGVFEVTQNSEEYRLAMKSAEEKVMREQYMRSAEYYSADREVTESVRQKQTDSSRSEIEIREGRFATPQLIESSVRPLYGRSVRGKFVPISSIADDSGKVVIWGDIFDMEKRVTRSGDKNIFSIDITDYTGSTTVKVFNSIRESAVLDGLKNGSTIAVMGDVEYDKYAGELVVNARGIGTAEKVKVVDKAAEKRVELHLHTNMSQMDAITSAGELVNRAYKWGHKAIAITDHGVAQAFPDALKAADKINKDGEKIKILYGTEAYFVDDLVESVSGEGEMPFDGSFVCFDLETTGLSPLSEKITEIGAVKVVNRSEERL